ncbi:protein arginine N-methyltransferase 5 isoform 3-T3 [Sarcoramphus papa]
MLERQRRACPQVLGRCGALLGRLAGERCAGAQAELDRHRAEYLEAKGAAMLLKIRLEELTVLLDTYPPEKVEAHRRIRFDFLCLPLFHPRHRREFGLDPARGRPGPQTRSDLLLSGRDWNTLIVGKLSPWIRPDSPLEHVRRNSEAAMLQELNFGAYLGLPAFLLPLTQAENPNLARVLCAHLHTGHHSAMFWVRVPLLAPEDVRDDLIGNEAVPEGGPEGAAEEKTWLWWHNFRTLCDYNKRVGVALEVGADLPSGAAIDRWLGEPVKAAILPTSVFLTNKKGFPVLSRLHQRLVFRLLKPLMDNLESQTYEVFEKDPIKYSQYQQAIYKCLLDRVPEEEKDSSVQVVMVLGAGRGPLVNATLRAARQAARRVRVYAVEKNPNAVVTLESWQYEEWGAQVTVVPRDMREWQAPEGADLVVSELLGSFADNELSPECLDGAQHCLKADGVSIPCTYTSFLAPISSSKLYNEVRACRERDRDPEAQFEMPYVVRLHNFHQLAPPQPCFSFQHPNPDPTQDNSRYRRLSFRVEVNTVLHGFAGYFETTLYGDITLSIRPETHSPGMFSWFPIFFPIKQPLTVRAGEEVSVAFWRCATPKKVWYEWAVTAPACSALHNPTGRSYTIGL